MDFLNVDLQQLMHFTVSPLELFLRGTLMFWFLFFKVVNDSDKKIFFLLTKVGNKTK